MEEIVSRNFIVHDQPDVVINIVDATNLERNLYLTLQLLQLGRPVVIALNQMDIVKKRGYTIKSKELSERLNLPVIENRCPVDKETKREEIKQLIYTMSETYPDLKDRIFGAMQRYPLAEWEPHGRYKRPKTGGDL